MIFRKLCFLASVVLLTSCASYSITEQEVQNYLDKQARVEQKVGFGGFVQAHVLFNDIKVGIGRSASDRINLEAKSKADISIKGQPQQKVAINVNFSAIPYYDKSEGAVYLNNLKVESLDITPNTLGPFASSQILSPLIEIVGQYLLKIPVYKLQEDDFKQSLLKTARPELKIKNHSLVIQI
ncbi:DUF1439 domain-containing protein [Photobacterium sp. 2_MG-2023]|uniref:DUF1439 domain-containing protein n=1 Tax=Photobacterium sp. 2_MG-2023 TaxID=3062663 RepID=UPI0026E228F6|nr:DUF1439 domain-containing protein [Photobacterium sp. 2_MG-2023]MDO6581875.1 DUF1439 domain-containing protein [Photobacterium sp. 2_MG-2023]